jgi:hypothetical protein
MNIIIISKIIYPVNSPRAYRTTELAIEFARQGHKVTVYSVLSDFNYSIFQKDTGVRIKDIGRMLFSSRNGDGKSSFPLIYRILYHTFHRLIEFPDIELMFKIPRILKLEDDYDMLITIAYPHPIHWGATLSKKILPNKKFPSTWISDCGDPYVGDPINKKKFFYFKFIEKWWGRNTDYITIPMEEGKQGYYPEFHSKIKVIPQGLNFENVKIYHPYAQNKIPTFAYAGMIYPGQRDPTQFLNYLCSIEIDFVFIVFTNNPKFYSLFKSKLKDRLLIKQYIPRFELIYQLSMMDFLINFANPGTVQIPSKIIDYLLTKRPILNVLNTLTEKNITSINEFLKGNYSDKLIGFDVEQYNITTVAQRFIELYHENKR